MRTIIHNDNGILESAHYEIYKGMPSVFINTVAKWVPCDSVGYGYSPELDKERVVEFTFYSEDGDEDAVFFITETEEEWEILNRVYFECHNKNQIWVIFPDLDGDKKMKEQYSNKLKGVIN